ncbi:HAD-IIB family hydrolase [Mycoplasma sp. 480]|uniref:HAD-IIB family hydrolase n=1 Tax=Mycoplasma sp. 480 TaxID=3440155 RepID=UPI003F515F25
MKFPKLLFLDLDGTLLDKGIGVWAKMSEKNKDAVLEYSKQYPVVISTGRTFNHEVEKIAKSVNAKFIVCQNGSIILDKNFKEIQNYKISQEVIKQILDEVINQKLTFVANPGSIVYGRGFWNKIYSLFSHFSHKDYEEFEIKELNKILVIGHSKKKIKNLFNDLTTKFHNQIDARIVGKNYAIEITRHDCSKGEAAKTIAEFLNIDLKESMHIGDSMNDSTTKNIVGTLVAMKSGSKRLQEIADVVGPRKQNGGVSKILKSFK